LWNEIIIPEDLGDLESNPNVRPKGKVQHVGISMNIRAEAHHIFLGWDADHPKVNAMRDVDLVTGAAMMIRRSVWNKVGGFLEAYGIGQYEDIDFCLSARSLGYGIIVETKQLGIIILAQVQRSIKYNSN